MQHFHIQWHITEICNLNCLHCYKETERQELSLQQLKIIADNINYFLNINNFALTLTVTGGEPFLKEEVYLVSQYVNDFEKVKRINFITNATILPSKKLKTLSKLDTIYVSIESLTPSVNDRIRGKGNFDIVFNNIKELVKEYRIGIMTTLMKENIEDNINNFENFIRKFFDIGVEEIIFERFIPTGASKQLKSQMLTKHDIFKFYSKVSDILKLDDDEIKKYPAIKILKTKSKNFDIRKLKIYGAKCIYAKDGFAILCDGTVYPCRRFDVAIENFLEPSCLKYKILLNKTISLIENKYIIDDFDTFKCYASLIKI
ncbi:MAG: radical SAM protein [Endomicrobia bacterium]|nr:radical SAM protein [Endomicrobiia bacterium]